MGTKGKPLPMEEHLAHKAVMASAAKGARETSPVPADETNLLAGAHIYQQGCAGCHGRLDQDPATMSKRFYPRPPQLLPPGEGVTDDPVGETHWVVKNGIRFSAMPAALKLNRPGDLAGQPVPAQRRQIARIRPGVSAPEGIDA